MYPPRSFSRLNVSHLNSIFYNSDGFIQPVDAQTIRAINPIELTVWASENGVYQFITTELVAWLKDTIGHKTAIEICAGKGTLGRALNIPRTDGFVQEQPDLAYKLKEMSEQPTNPPHDVYRFEALQAVRYFKPQVVVGSFVTQIYKPGENYNVIMSSPVGVNEELIVRKVKTYICIGNQKTHFGKRIFNIKHKEYAFPWLLNRCEDQGKNRIWLWNR